MKKDSSIYLIKNDNNRKGKLQNLTIYFTKHWSDKKNYLHILLKIKNKKFIVIWKLKEAFLYASMFFS